MKRNISAFGLLCVSATAILGSGWLFSSYYASTEAGPASLLSWIIGGIIIIIVAFTFSEICAMIPVSGSSVRIPKFTHGNVLAIMFSLIIWLTYITLMVIEAQAVIQYLSYFYPWLVYSSGGLTLYGYIFAACIMVIIAIINNYSLRWLINCNAFLTVLKFIIPVFFCIILLSIHFSPHNIIHAGGSTFMPYGIHGVLYAVAGGGIIFTFNGFKQSAELAGEVKNPQFAVPFAIIGSLIVCLIVYLFLQGSLLSAITPHNIAAGWSHMTLSDVNSPLTSLLLQSHVLWFIPILLFIAVVSPFASSLIYCTGSSRTLFGISINGLAPKSLAKVSKKNIPVNAIWVNFVIGMVIFLFFKGWASMSDFITCLLALSYATAPICLIALRQQAPDIKRPLKLPFARVWAFISLYFSTLFIYWCGWDIIYKMGIFLFICFLIIMIFQTLQANGKVHIGRLDWVPSLWMWIYFIGIVFISFIGNYGGGLHWIHTIPIMILIAIFTCVVLYLGLKFKMPSESVLENIKTDYK
ncbi:MAG: APC family permease [bacterium]|nr:APC family permease [bacterium]